MNTNELSIKVGKVIDGAESIAIVVTRSITEEHEEVFRSEVDEICFREARSP